MGDSTPDISNSANAAPAARRPARFWWLKRLAVVFTIFIGVVIAFDVWWSREADRRYQAAIDEIRARGEPVVPEDFDVSGVPDAQNAALSLQAASQPLSSGVPAQLTERQIVTLNAASLRLARRARSQPGVDWKIKLRSHVFASLLPNLNPQRELSRLLNVSVQYHHAIGDDREAVETIRDMLNQAHVLSRGPTVLVVHLTSLGLEGMAYEAVEEIAPDLRVEAGGTAAPGATRQQVLGLIADLNDDAQFSSDARRGWQGERVQVLDGIRTTFPFGPNSPSNLAFWAKPAFELDGLRSAGDVDRCAAASAQPNWPTARSMLPPDRVTSHESGLEALSTVLSNILAGGISRAVEQDFRSLVDRRGTVLRLTIRLYQADHGGAYPRTLGELVPKYLPAVPVDPYAADGRAMSYRAGAPFPAVWSVGSNGVDDGGTSLPNDSGQSNTPPFVRWDCADIVYPLERIAPASQPSPETQNSQ